MQNKRRHSLSIIIALFLVTTLGFEAAAEEKAAESFGPGNHFGMTLRLAVPGAWGLHWEEDWGDGDTENRYEYGGLKASPGLGFFWEYLTAGGILAPGIWLGLQFHSWDQFTMSYNLGMELQIDPRLRIYMRKSGWWRPYAQLAAGFSIGIPSNLLGNENRTHVNYALAINASAALGSLLVPRDSPVAFFLDLGIEGVFFWSESESSEGEALTKYNGYAYYMLIAAGLEF